MWTVNDMTLTAGALEPTFAKWNSIRAAAKVTSVLVKLCCRGEAEHSADNSRRVDVPSGCTVTSFRTERTALVINISAIVGSGGAFQCYPSWVVDDFSMLMY